MTLSNCLLPMYHYSFFNLKKIMSLGDQSKDGFLSFEEFLQYMSDHEKKLWLVFKSIDVDDNGRKAAFSHFV